MEILTGIQPNCSELVVRLGDVGEEYVKAELASIGIEEYLIRDTYNRASKEAEWDGDKNVPKIVKVADLPREVMQAWEGQDSEDKIVAKLSKEILEANDIERYESTITLNDGLTPMGGFAPGVWIGNDPDDSEYAAIWYHQHCQRSGFPMLQKIAHHFGAEVDAYDGGSIDDYEAFLNGEEYAEDE